LWRGKYITSWEEAMFALMQGMLSNLKETAKSILVSQTIGIVVNGDEADATKLRGTSHSTPKEPKDYTKNVDSVNRDVDRSKYQQTNADENSNVDTQAHFANDIGITNTHT
jgi:hypothetical protein